MIGPNRLCVRCRFPKYGHDLIDPYLTGGCMDYVPEASVWLRLKVAVLGWFSARR